MKISEFYNEIETIFRENLENRSMHRIYLPEMFSGAVQSLKDANHVVIVTGFVVKDALAGETDGPPGALAMAKCLESLGKKVTLLTDLINEPLLKSGVNYLNLKASLIIVKHDNYKVLADQLFNDKTISHMIAIERPSQASDGHFYSMRGEVLTPYVSNTDILFNRAKEHNIITIGIGDGGNEIGMGKIKEEIERFVPNGSKICATTHVDYLVLAGVSNWGAYGICGALSIEYKTLLLPENNIEIGLLEQLVKSGAVDGFEKIPTMKVDGINLNENMAILNKIRNIVKNNI